MRIKFLFLFLICVLNFHYSEAQKTKAMGIELLMPEYPLVVLPESFKTYSVAFSSQGVDLKEFSNIENPIDKIQLNDFNRIKGVADLNIVVKIEKLTLYKGFGTAPINSLDELKGSPSSTTIDYYVDISFEVTDNRNIIIQCEYTTSPGSFSTIKETQQTPQQSSAIDLSKNVSNYINNCIKPMNDRLRELFDITRKKYLTTLYGIKSSKTENFDEYTDAVKKMNDLFYKSPKNEIAIREVIQAGITLWEAKLPTFDQTTEVGKAYAFVCSYDLAFAYSMLNDLDKADENAKKAIASNHDPRMATFANNAIQKFKKKKEKYLSDREKATKNTGLIYQQHGEKGSSLGIFFLVTPKEETTSALEKGFVITTSGDSLFGNFVEFDFNIKGGKILFAENGKSQKEFKAPYESLQKFSLRGEIYYYFQKGLRKVAYYSPSIVVLSNNAESIFIFVTQNTARVYTMFDPNDGAAYIINYKKKLGEVFKGICPAIEEKSLKGAYNNLKEEGTACIMPAIKDFEMQCGSKEYDKHLKALEMNKIEKLYR